MTATASAKINVVRNHTFVPADASVARECAVTGCYAPLRCHTAYVTAVYNHLYAAAVVSLPGAVSEGKLVAAHIAAAQRVSQIFNIR